MKTDEFLNDHAGQGVRLTVKLLDSTTVLIEGSPASLRFLSELILAHVDGNEDGRRLSPTDAGQVFFDKKSTHGLYLHILPCGQTD